MNKKLAWITVFVWMIVIFYLSHQPATISNELSKSVAKVVAGNIDFVSSRDDFNLSSVNNIVRKQAHFWLYFALGILVVSSLRRVGMTGVKGFMLSIVICVIYAVTDEWHQLFVPGRGGQVSDVVIDSSGAVAGIVFILFIRRVTKFVVGSLVQICRHRVSEPKSRGHQEYGRNETQ